MSDKTETPVATIENNAIAAMVGRGTKIPGDVVNIATANLPDQQRSAIRRLHAHYVEHDLSIEETARLIDKTGAVVSLIFRGKYDAGLSSVVKDIESFFELYDKRAQGRKLSFIKTDLTEQIWKVCDAAVEFQKVAFIFGDMQIGKTEALKAYQIAHNHGSTIYVSVPTGGALLNFLTVLARKLRISENLSITKLRERIINAFDDRMLLIVDEAHRCIRDSGNSTMPIQTIEFIREIFDEKACGVVICATNVFRDAMDSGPVEKILRQTKRRRLCALQLPNTPTRKDLNTFAAGYGLKPSFGLARELEARMVEAEALGMWLTLLRMGSKIAGLKKEALKWEHVLQADAGLKELEGKKF
jgi:DNA transposition AAA+ family ATPase